MRTRPAGTTHLGLSRRVEEPAEIAKRPLALAISFARLGPLPGQAIRREPVRGRLIEVSIGPDDVDPARRQPIGRAISHRDLDPPALPSAGAVLATPGRSNPGGVITNASSSRAAAPALRSPRSRRRRPAQNGLHHLTDIHSRLHRRQHDHHSQISRLSLRESRSLTDKLEHEPAESILTNPRPHEYIDARQLTN